MSLILYLILFLCSIFIPNSRQARSEEKQIRFENQPSASDEGNEGHVNWLKHFNQVFHGDQKDLKSPRELVEKLERLHAESFRVVSMSPELRDKSMEVFELIKLSHVFPSSCTATMFYILDSLAKEYSEEEGYNVAISNYINYFRDQFWLTCERSFIEGQRHNIGLVHEDETEALSMVDHILAVLSGQFHGSNQKLYLEINPEAFLQGIINYVDDKLGDDPRAVDKSKIDELFVDTISPVCGSVRYRFTGKAKMEEIIDGREDLENRLDSKSIKWLIAKKVCNNILAKLLFYRDEISRRKIPLYV